MPGVLQELAGDIEVPEPEPDSLLPVTLIFTTEGRTFEATCSTVPAFAVELSALITPFPAGVDDDAAGGESPQRSTPSARAATIRDRAAADVTRGSESSIMRARATRRTGK